MLDEKIAVEVTKKSIELTSGKETVDFEGTLLSQGISKTQISLLEKNIAASLAELNPPFKINLKFFDGIGENSTPFDVFNIIRKDAIPA